MGWGARGVIATCRVIVSVCVDGKFGDWMMRMDCAKHLESVKHVDCAKCVESDCSNNFGGIVRHGWQV